MSAPTYSIAMPVYGRVFGFDEALASALAVQGCSEVLVIDDASPHDEFERIVASFADERVRYIRNEANVGLFGNWNRGVELARGEFVSILCSDDIIDPKAYSLFLDAHRADPTVDVFFGPFCTFSDSPDRTITHRTYTPGRMAAADLMADAVRNGAAFPVLTIARREKVLARPFVAKPHSGNDWLWIYANAPDFNLHASAHPLSYWRRHPDQDAAKSQSITTDCWPLMYTLMAQHLRSIGHPLASQATRRAKGVVLNWLLGDPQRTHYWRRLRGEEAASNLFLKAALELVQGDWLLSRMLGSAQGDRLYKNLGRTMRKTGYYPAS